MRTLKIVVGQKVREPILRVDCVREHRPPQKLVPQGLPESLDLPQRLRMLRSAPDVLDAHPLEHLFELRLAPPHRVLPPVVRQYLGGLPVRGNAALEGFHHQRRFLVMRERVSHHKPAVVIHEHAHVQPLGSPQPKREDVRLPQLVGHRPLEPPRQVLARNLGRWRLDQSLVVQDPSHRLLRDAQCLEPRQHIADAPRAPALVLLLQRDHLFALHGVHRVRRLPRPVRRCSARLEPVRPAFAKCLHPFRHRRLRYAERFRDVVLLRPPQSFLNSG